MKIIDPHTCSVCKKDYGLTNLTYQEIPFYAACNCCPRDNVYFLDATRIEARPKALQKCSEQDIENLIKRTLMEGKKQ